MKFRVHTEYSIMNDGYALAILQEREDGSRAFVQPFTLRTYEPGDAVPHNEAFAITDTFGGANVRALLQAMSDAAWELGIKPKQVEGHASELKAVRYHLEDMRTLA